MCVSVYAFVRSGDGREVFAGMTELIVLELRACVSKSPGIRLTGKSGLRRPRGPRRGSGKASLCPLSPNEEELG